MGRMNSRETRGDSGNPGNLTGEGSGQQSSGNRGEKMNKDDKVHYRASQHPKKTGRHGDNR
jgi:hypothetical protein